jgi:hypothetical protein
MDILPAGTLVPTDQVSPIRAADPNAIRLRVPFEAAGPMGNDVEMATFEAGPGGHGGATVQSSAAGLLPHTGTSDQPLPGPATTTLDPTIRSGQVPVTTG